MYTARRQMRKILNRAEAIRTIQRNARVYGELREWPWWQLYTKVSVPQDDMQPELINFHRSDLYWQQQGMTKSFVPKNWNWL